MPGPTTDDNADDYRLEWPQSDFVARLRAAKAIRELPLSVSRIQRVVTIVFELLNNNEHIDSEFVDASGKQWIRTTDRPRYTFRQRKTLCSEVQSLLNGQVAAAQEFVRLQGTLLFNGKKRPRRTAKPLDDEAIKRYRPVIHSLLDELSSNAMTPVPTRNRIRQAMKRKGIKLENDVLSILVREWKGDRAKPRVGPHGPQRTD